MKPPRILLWISIFVFLALSFSVVYSSKKELPPSIDIKIKGHPTLGYAQAKVHLVLFEEPKCTHCREFTEQIFPEIKKEFIDTNKISFTIIPVSFLPGSMPAAIATLCVYHEDPLYPNDELFFKFIDYLYAHQPDEMSDWGTPENLIAYAKATSPAIKLPKLRKCIDMETYRVQIEKNTDYGKQVMGGKLMTPTLFVNGIQVEELSLENVSRLIREMLEYEGVY